MRKILITGANSYIGMSFEQYMNQWSDKYSIDTVDMVDGSWRDKEFAGYDVVFHVAGLAHVDVGHASEETKKKYYAINTDLTIETAKKAKNNGVRQFIFMSSAIVFGNSAPMGKLKIITKNTKPKPENFYGNSKLQAEEGILPLSSDGFKIVVLRPPMIYGKGSKGNYPMLARLAKKMPVFPSIKNQRSMLYVGNLCEFIRLMIDNEEAGIFHPQNGEVVSTSKMVKEIANIYGRKIRITKLLNPFVWLLSKMPGKIGNLANKAFGNFAYDIKLSEYKEKYVVYDFKESMKKTEEL